MQWHKIPMGVLNAVSILALSLHPSLSLTKCEDCMLALIYLGAHLVAFHSKKEAVSIFLPALTGSLYLPGLLHVMHSRRW